MINDSSLVEEKHDEKFGNDCMIYTDEYIIKIAFGYLVVRSISYSGMWFTDEPRITTKFFTNISEAQAEVHSYRK